MLVSVISPYTLLKDSRFLLFAFKKKNKKTFYVFVQELDDGAYNPLWTMRGFTQTFHFWKENKRAQCVPLNAFLTYVTLPWWSIAKGKSKFESKYNIK